MARHPHANSAPRTAAPRTTARPAPLPALLAGQQRCVDAVLEALAGRRPLCAIAGAAGCGRSLVAAHLMRRARSTHPQPVRLDAASATHADVLDAVAEALELPVARRDDRSALLDTVVRVMGKGAARGRHARRIVVDDADRLSAEALESIVRLAALAPEGRAGVCFVLVGAVRLAGRLAVAQRAFHARPAAMLRLGALRLDETRALVATRLGSGRRARPQPTPACLLTLHLLARGNAARVLALVDTTLARLPSGAAMRVPDLLRAALGTAGALPRSALAKALQALAQVRRAAAYSESQRRALRWTGAAAAVALGFVLGQAGPSLLVHDVRAAATPASIVAPVAAGTPADVAAPAAVVTPPATVPVFAPVAAVANAAPLPGVVIDWSAPPRLDGLKFDADPPAPVVATVRVRMAPIVRVTDPADAVDARDLRLQVSAPPATVRAQTAIGSVAATTGGEPPAVEPAGGGPLAAGAGPAIAGMAAVIAQVSEREPSRTAPAAMQPVRANAADPQFAPTSLAPNPATASPSATTPATAATPSAATAAKPAVATARPDAKPEPRVEPRPESRAESRAEKKLRASGDELSRAGDALAVGRNVEAIALLRKVLAAEPANHEARANLISVLGERAKDDEWLEALEQGARVSPERFGLAAAQGHLEAGRLEAADAILASVPNELRDARHFALAGVVLTRMQRYDAALAAYDAALRRSAQDNPKRRSMQLARAVVLEHLGRLGEARAIYQAAADEDGTPSTRAFARSRLATLDSDN